VDQYLKLLCSLGEKRSLQPRPLEPPQSGNEARQACTTQRQIGFPCLPAETLQDRNGIVTDAVNRKKDGIGAAHDPGEQPLAGLHATIVVQKFSVRLLNKGPNTRDVPRAPPDVEEASALEIGRRVLWLSTSVSCGGESCASAAANSSRSCWACALASCSAV
jgi:hypothetical protein